MGGLLVLVTFIMPIIGYMGLFLTYPKFRSGSSFIVFLCFFPAIWLAGMWFLFVPFMGYNNSAGIGIGWLMAFCMMYSIFTVPLGILIWIFSAFFGSKNKDEDARHTP